MPRRRRCATSHSCTVPSLPAEASVSPSGVNAMPQAASWLFSGVLRTRRRAMSHSRTVPSSPADASVWPSAPNDTRVTALVWPFNDREPATAVWRAVADVPPQHDIAVVGDALGSWPVPLDGDAPCGRDRRELAQHALDEALERPLIVACELDRLGRLGLVE